MAENRTLEQEIAERTDTAETTEVPPTQRPIFGNISLALPKKRSARRLERIMDRVWLLMGAWRRNETLTMLRPPQSI